jgi:hypothetical protein
MFADVANDERILTELKSVAQVCSRHIDLQRCAVRARSDGRAGQPYSTASVCVQVVLPRVLLRAIFVTCTDPVICASATVAFCILLEQAYCARGAMNPASSGKAATSWRNNKRRSSRGIRHKPCCSRTSYGGVRRNIGMPNPQQVGRAFSALSSRWLETAIARKCTL